MLFLPRLGLPGHYPPDETAHTIHDPAPEVRKSLAQVRKPWVALKDMASPVGGDTNSFAPDDTAKTSDKPVPPGTIDSSPLRFRGALALLKEVVGLGFIPD